MEYLILKDLATGEFHYSNLAVEQAEADTDLGIDTRRLPATILRSESFKLTAIEAATNEYIAVGTDYGVIHLIKSWGDPHRDLLGADGQITSMHFSSDDTKLVASTSEGSIFVWDLTTSSPFHVATASGPAIGAINSVKFSSSGALIAAGDSAGNIIVFDLVMNVKFTNSDHVESINGIVFTSDDKYIISASSDGNINVTDVVSGLNFYTHADELHVGKVTSIDLAKVEVDDSSDDVIITGGEDGFVRVATWNEGAFLAPARLAGHASEVTSVKFALLSNIFYSCDESFVKTWELDSATMTYSNSISAKTNNIVPKFMTTYGNLPYTCDGESKNVYSWLGDSYVQEIFIYAQIVQVVVWPDPLLFNIKEPSWPAGPITSISPITCYAKRVGSIDDMRWEEDFKDISIEDVPIKGYYTHGFSTDIYGNILMDSNQD